jgi:tripartite-type tricarboxylate transporter receptor subunit TctC
MRRMKWLCVMVVLLAVGLAASVSAADFPTKDLSGIICWGAGGATDNISRGVTPYVEKVLGKQIVLQNKPGATGAVGLMTVYNSPADGYNLLYAAENPPLYKVLDVGQIDYDAFTPVMLFARNVGVIVSNNDQPWKTLGDLFAAAKKTPGQIKLGSTGVGGLPDVVSSFLKANDGVTFNHIIFGGAGPAITALLGGHVQITVLGMAECREHLRAGRLRALAVVSEVPIAEIKDVPLITATNAAYKKILPWGPFYGVFVKKETPEPIKKTLIDAFQKGAADPKVREFIANFGSVFMGLSGAEAEAYIKKFQSITTWALQDAGATKFPPDKFGIPKP